MNSLNREELARREEQQKAIRKTLIKSICGLVLMFAFAFALVPLYEIICEVTGLNGRSKNLLEQSEQSNVDEIILDKTRQVRLQFVSVSNKHVPWEFFPTIDEVVLHPGEVKTFTYRAKNLTGKNMVVQAVPSVSPNEAASYLRKIECFCFNSQPLAAGADVALPVRVYIHHALPKDVNTLTLAYTLFDITESSDYEKLSEHDHSEHDHEHEDEHEHDEGGS